MGICYIPTLGSLWVVTVWRFIKDYVFLPLAMENIKVLTNEKVGRYAVASRPLSEGDTIMEEEPLMLGPKASTVPLCLGCFAPVHRMESPCPKCKWPMCSKSCWSSQLHEAECPILSSATFFGTPDTLCPQYECISPLRLLLAMEAQPERWRREVEPMQTHMEEAREHQPELWQAQQVNVVNYLINECHLKGRFSEEMINKACCILDVNSFEAITPDGQDIRAVYPMTAILSHNCVANTCHSILSYDNYKMQLRCTVSVGEGEELFCSYTGSLQTTLNRRDNLKFSKFFWCDCARCADPTELGTNLSTLKCTKCDNGVIRSSDPLDEGAPWKCSHCDNGINANGVRRVLATVQAEIEQLETMDMGPEKLQNSESILRKYKSVFHPNHALNVSIWYLLIQMYGRVENYTINELPNILLERKISLCQNFLSILDKVEPGFTRIRGLTLYELHVVLMTLARSQYADHQLTRSELKQALENVVTILDESIRILSLEPVGCRERQLAIVSYKSLQQLKQSIDSL